MENKFFTPVAKDVRYQIRVVLCTLAPDQIERRFPVKIGFESPLPLIELGNNRTVQKFVLNIAIEINPEVRRNHSPQVGPFWIGGNSQLNRRSLGRMHFARHMRPHLVTTAGRINISGHGTAIFLFHDRLVTKNDLTLVIAEFGNVFSFFILRMYRPNFASRMVRIKITDIAGKTITQAQRVTKRPVVIQGRSSIHDFVKAVIIQVADSNIEVALAIETLARCFGLVEPALFQVLAVKVVGHHVGRRIVTTGSNQARVNAIEVSRRREKTVAAVTIGIAPVETQRIIGAKISDIARREVINRRDFGAIAAPEHRQVFRSRNNNPRLIAVILRRIPDDLALAINGSVAGLHDNFGLAVTVVVIHLERRVVRTTADVLAEAYAPKLCTVEFIGIEENRSRIRAFHLLRIVLEVVRHPLHDEFVFAVAIQVADAHVVGSVTGDCLFFIRHHLVFGAVQLKYLIREGLPAIGNSGIENEGYGLLCAFLAAHHSSDGILGRYFSILVQVIGPGRFPYGGNFRTIAVKIEFRIGTIRTKQAPRDEHPRFSGIGDNEATVKGFHLARMCGGKDWKRKNQRQNT